MSDRDVQIADAEPRSPGTPFRRPVSFAEIKKHRLFQMYLREVSRGEAGGVIDRRDPWLAVGALFLRALFMRNWQVAHVSDLVDVMHRPNPEARAVLVVPDEADAAGYTEAGAIWGLSLATRARVYSVRPWVRDLMEEAPMPAHVFGRDQTPWPLAYIDFQEPIALSVREAPALVHSMCLMEQEWGVRILTELDYGRAGPVVFLPTDLSYGDRFVPDTSPDFPLTGLALRFLAFINSPYVRTASERPSRQVRRAVGRDLNPDRDYSVIVLREPADLARPADGAARDGSPIYKHQWWVRAHYRAQWYPSREEHRVIWIRPYLKGPPGAPLVHHVYDVRR